MRIDTDVGLAVWDAVVSVIAADGRSEKSILEDIRAAEGEVVGIDIAPGQLSLRLWIIKRLGRAKLRCSRIARYVYVI